MSKNAKQQFLPVDVSGAWSSCLIPSQELRKSFLVILADTLLIRPMNRSAVTQLGHTEAVKITFDPEVMSCERLVQIYWQRLIQQMPWGNFRPW